LEINQGLFTYNINGYICIVVEIVCSVRRELYVL